MTAKKFRILLAEDDENIRSTLVDSLVLVHDVVATRNAPEALRELGKTGSHFDCLVTDFSMPPHESGAAVVRAFLKRFPLAPTIMISAHIIEGPFADREIVGLLEEVPSLAFLPKPFECSLLLKTIARLREGA